MVISKMSLIDEIAESILPVIGGILLPLIPVIFGVLAYFDLITFWTAKLCLLVFFILFVVLPIIYKHSVTLQRYAVFLTFVHAPPSADYNDPESYGVTGSRNFYIKTDDDVVLGVWQILPENKSDIHDKAKFSFEDAMDDGQDIVIYSHGNGGTRLTSHRLEIYHVLRKFFHVFALDYRNYGDSSRVSPDENGVVKDVMTLYKWVANRTKGNIFIWGHSLGTSISSHAMTQIQDLDIQKPLGLILEAPFNNMKEEISEFPLAKLFKYLPWFNVTVVEPMAANFPFTTDKYICDINVPIVILHAEDDRVVPYKLGLKLYESAVKCRSVATTFYKFDGKHQFGHKYICRAEDLPQKIKHFINYAYSVAGKKQNQY